MDNKRISLTDIVVGVPLSWDVYDANNVLLLRKGHVIEKAHQIEALMERGLFVDAKNLPGNQTPPQPKEKPSVVRLINTANKKLEAVLVNLQNEQDASKKIIEIAKVLGFAVEVNSDVALACILLNQESCNYATRHSVDTALVSLLIARSLNKPAEEITSTVAAALTMNVGMLQHQSLFQNKGEALTPLEKQIISTHPEEGARLLQQAGVTDQNWINYVLTHHENEDGTGYPSGMKNIDIPENTKIIAIADRYCARVSNRNYRKSLLPNAALRDILLSEKTTISPQLSASFIRELGVYPTGTYVRLENGEIGVVTGKGSTTTTPVVHALIGPRGAPLSFPIKRDTTKSLFAVREVLDEEKAAAQFSMQQLWGDDAAL